MGKISLIFVAILGIFLLLGPFRQPIADGIKGWRTETQVQTVAVVTAGGVTSANVTLSADLFQDDVAEVSSISSNDTGDAPAASTYTAATKVLLVSGLVAASNHTLTLTYYADTDDTVMAVVGPFLGILIFGGLTIGFLVRTWHNRRG